MVKRKKTAAKKKVDRKTTSKKKATRKQDPKSKQCARCLKRKPLDSFGKNPRMKLGRKSYCRDCSSELQREWNEEQREAQKPKRKRR